MTDNAVSREDAGSNLPVPRGGMQEGAGGLDPWDTSRGRDYGKYDSASRRPTATFDGRGGNSAFEAGESSELVNYSAVLRKLWRRKFLLAAIAVVGIGGATVIIARMPAHYVAHAFVVIGDPLGKSRLSYGANQTGGIVSLPDNGTVLTEVEVLKSPQLALEVIRDLKLENNPEFNAAAAPVEQPGTWSRAKEWLFGPQAASDPQADAAAELSQTIDNFLGRLRISVKDNSRMLDVAFDASNPRLAMQVTNALVDRYVNNQLELRLQSVQRTSSWLHDKILQLQAKVEDAEKAVEQFRSQAGLFSAPGGQPLLLKQMTDVSAELANAQTARAAVEARLNQLRASGQPSGRGGPTSDVVDSPFMRTLDGQQADAEQKLAEASTSLGERNPATLGLRERLRNIQMAKRNEGFRVSAALENDLKIARMKESGLSDRLGRLQNDVVQMNRSEINLRALEREAQADRLVLNNYIARFKETSHEDDISSQRPDAQIVSHAQLPVSPDRPKRGLLILIAGMASLIGGALAALMIEKADRRLHSLEEVEGRLKITGLGMLPLSKPAQLSPSEAARYGSSYREAAKATYSRLFCGRTTPKVTVVTSAFPGEGKTTLALSLAAMAAQSGKRVLFVDGDFWRSGAGAVLGIRSSAGLADLLEGKAKLVDAVMSDVTSGADIILPGKFSRASLVAWIGKLPELLDALKSQYDVIIIDAPPILAVSEATLLAGHADATVMVIRWASTPWDAAKIALKKLHDAGASVAGSVLTMVCENRHAKYGYPQAAHFSKYLASYRPPTGAVIPSAAQQRSGQRNDWPRLNDSLTSGRSIEGGSSRHALLVLDIQETFTFSPRRDSQSPEACDRLIEAINGLSQVAFRSDIMVLYAHQERANPLARSPSRFVVKKVDGNRRSPEHLKLVPGYSFIKPGKDAFSNVELDDFLRKNGITHLFLVGSDGVTSIRQTARSALDLGYRVTFIQDGIFTAFESKWERVLNSFESEAAFAIASEEFAEFAAAVRQASEARRRSHERDLLRDAPDLTQASVTDKPATAPLPANDKPLMPARDNPTTTAQESAREPQATQAPASDKPATAPLPANDKLVQAAGDKPATMETPTMETPTVPLEAPTDSPRAQQWVASIASSLATDSARARRWIASIASSLATDSPRARQWIAATALVVVLAATGWLYRSEVANHVEMTIPAATWAGDEKLAQVKQALQQEHDKTEKLARELTTDLAQIKQVPQQERDKTEKLATDLVQVKQALQQERDKTETLASELATDLAQVKQALQQERDKTEKLARELTTDLAQIKQVPQQERDKTEKLATDLVQVKQALQQEFDKTEKLASELAADLAQVKQAPQQDRDKAEKLTREFVTDLAQVKQALQQQRDKSEKLTRELATDLAQVKQALQQQHDKSEKLTRELVADLAQVKQAQKQTEMQAGTYGELLVQERARNRKLEAQLAARQDATAGGSRNATSAPPAPIRVETPGPTQASATDKPATAALPANDKPVVPARDKPATMTAPEVPGNSEAARLMARASLLRDQGNIGAARIVLERAAETGNASALFALAETYDPLSLSAWGTFGTQGDAAKAQELYAKALAGGVHEAGDRLNALRQ